MHIFLIAAAPLSYIYALVLRDEAGESSAFVGVSALRGALAYLIELAVLLLLARFAPRTYSGIGSYFYSVLYDFGIPVLGTFLFFLWFTPDVRGLAARERSLTLLSFLAGALSLAGIMDLFVRAEFSSVYEIFLLPALRVSAMLLVPFLYRLFVEETFWTRYLYIAALVALPFAFSTAFYLVVLNFHVAAILGTAAVFLGGWAVVILPRTTAAVRG